MNSNTQGFITCMLHFVHSFFLHLSSSSCINANKSISGLSFRNSGGTEAVSDCLISLWRANVQRRLCSEAAKLKRLCQISSVIIYLFILFPRQAIEYGFILVSKWQRDKAQLFIFTHAKLLVRAFRPAMIQQPNAQRSPRTHDARRCHTLPLSQAALLAHLTLTSGSLEGGAQQLWLTGSVLHSY